MAHLERSAEDFLSIFDSARVVTRNYLSTHFLWAAYHFSRRAEEIERKYPDDVQRFFAEHRAHVLGSVISSVQFMDASVNEIFQDAAEGTNLGPEGYATPLSADARSKIVLVWTGDGNRRRAPLVERFDLLLRCAGLDPMDHSVEPYASAYLLVQLRNRVVHFKPEDSAVDIQHELEKQLKHRFTGNALMPHNPWWPDRALGHGCATWAIKTARAYTDDVFGRLGLSPNYRIHAVDRNWEGFGNPMKRRRRRRTAN